MDWTTILNGLAWVMGLLGVSFLAYGGWVCLRQVIGELAQSPRREAPKAPAADPVKEHRLVA